MPSSRAVVVGGGASMKMTSRRSRARRLSRRRASFDDDAGSGGDAATPRVVQLIVLALVDAHARLSVVALAGDPATRRHPQVLAIRRPQVVATQLRALQGFRFLFELDVIQQPHRRRQLVADIGAWECTEFGVRVGEARRGGQAWGGRRQPPPQALQLEVGNGGVV